MRDLSGPVGRAVSVWALVWACLHVYWAGFGFPEPLTTRALHILAFLPPAFLLFPATGRSPRDRPSLLDGILCVLALAPPAYVAWQADAINLRIPQLDPVSPAEVVLGAVGIVLLLEAVRRAVAPVLSLISALALAYLFTTASMPGFLRYRSIPTSEIVEAMYLSGSQGLFGFITGVSATIVAAFIIFGAFIEGTGSGRLFMNLGTRAAGRFSGGAAKVEVVTSAMFGMISGSSTANVVSVGSFTIPSMIRRGYTPTFSAAVEAASSTGGQIMPPIMGAAAFIMAETIQTPYSRIIVAAVAGAFLYYFCIFMTVHFEARKLGLKGLSEAELPSWRDVRRDAHLLLPIAAMVVLLHAQFSANYAAFWSIAVMLAVAGLRAHTRIGPAHLARILARGGKNVVSIALACTCANIIVTALTMTGLTLAIGSAIMSISGGELLIIGTLLMVFCMILGMGMPTSAAYVIAASIGAPLLIRAGVPELAAHMFVFYFAVFADVTPPVAVASYAAAAIAKADPMKVGGHAFRLAMGGFLVGYSYLSTEALLLSGPVTEIVGYLVLNLTGLTLIAAALTGCFRDPLPVWIRAGLLVVAIVICVLHTVPVWYRSSIGMAMLLLLFPLTRRRASKPATLPEGV